MRRSRNDSKAAGAEIALRSNLTVIDRSPEAVETALMNKS
jgi:hypothetical protein